MTEARARTVAVAGDQLIDWMLVSDVDADVDIDIEWVWQVGIPFQLASQPLGAEPLGELLARLLRRDGGAPVVVARRQVPEEALTDPGYPGMVRTITLWTPVADERGRGPAAWRIRRVIGRADAVTTPPAAPVEPAQPPDLVVLEDLGFGFRDDRALWDGLLAHKPCVLLRTTTPFGTGALWEKLTATVADRLTVLVDATDLRRASLQVEQPLSWEHIYDHVVKAVQCSPLAAAERVIVTLGLAGAVIVHDSGQTLLAYDPHLQENERERLGTRFVWGHQIVMLAALARDALAAQGDEAGAVLAGLHAMRSLHRCGFEARGESGRTRLSFPVVGMVEALNEPPVELFTASLGDEQRASGAILFETMHGEGLEEAARQAAHEGPGGLRGVPLESIGAWSSVDRAEIENLRAIRAILAEYVHAYRSERRVSRPLSIAVFGPPGSGKSFAVKQLAASLLAGASRTLEFNLSQFADDQRLAAAFHAVRDVVVEQRLPVVFWDEFDTAFQGQPLGWLRHFLAPMQDGEFTEGDATHPLGPAIFVFAGGTSSTFEAFSATGDEVRDRQAKKSDFVSRLRGYLNVLGPNPAGPGDVAFVLRRALLLHSLLRRTAPGLFADGRLAIDEGLLEALLHVTTYRHGARSMEAVIAMSALTGKASFERSSLPAPRQLALHVDADDFLARLEATRCE
jgi:hypothetical protein